MPPSEGPCRRSKRRRLGEKKKKLRIGFICGKEDGDLVLAPSIPAKHWVSSAFLEEPPPHRPLKERVHTDVAIWWHVRQHYGSVVEADLISAPGEVTAERLARNDVNLLLGWDAVSAHLEEHWNSEFASGHAAAMRDLLRAPASRVWPPPDLQELCNNKGAYLSRAADRGVAVAPTEVYRAGDSSTSFADFALAVARRRGWAKFVAKPSPSSWSRGVEAFSLDDADLDSALAAYVDDAAGAAHIILQRHLSGLEDHPETRCFFFGHDFMYAVANSRHHPTTGALLDVTDHPESASTAADERRALPTAYWHPHKTFAEHALRAILPTLTAFDGTPLAGFPWLVRLDLGTHPAPDLLNAQPDDRLRADRDAALFLNEIEIVPTLYLDAKFDHDHDFIAEYAAKFVKSAALAAAFDCPELDAFEPLHPPLAASA